VEETPMKKIIALALVFIASNSMADVTSVKVDYDSPYDDTSGYNQNYVGENVSPVQEDEDYDQARTNADIDMAQHDDNVAERGGGGRR
jgi:hypothetical protein